MFNFKLIQGGMGAGVSNYNLAKAVSITGNLGVVAGTALDVIMARRLMDGDKSGDVRRALLNFPDKIKAEKIIDKYYIEGGVNEGEYKNTKMLSINSDEDTIDLVILSNYVEVYLAKENHKGLIGINLLEKIQLPNIYSIYGAMLAGVDFLLMGAGIPIEIPDILTGLYENRQVRLRLNITGHTDNFQSYLEFDPSNYIKNPDIKKPKFIPIISSNILAETMIKKTNGDIFGFVIENNTAGGHNAPPRGKLSLDENNEPIYGEKDNFDIEKFKKLGYPFYLAGGLGNNEGLETALKSGANGIQVGSPFALCKESGFTENIKFSILQSIKSGIYKVITDVFASPTGFPFKVFEMKNTLSDQTEYELRPKTCDLGYLREIHRNEDDSIVLRCPSSNINELIKKGIDISSSIGKKCLCNGLLANIGLAKKQISGYIEKPLITLGSNLKIINELIEKFGMKYSAEDVINFIMGTNNLNNNLNH